MYRFENGSLYFNSRLIAEVRTEIYDARGAKIGRLQGKSIYGRNGKIFGTIIGEGIYDENMKRVGSLRDLRKSIDSVGDSVLAALWLLLVR
jgi:rRNA processing protein Gar1